MTNVDINDIVEILDETGAVLFTGLVARRISREKFYVLTDDGQYCLVPRAYMRLADQ